jgi:hypothetical protein
VCSGFEPYTSSIRTNALVLLLSFREHKQGPADLWYSEGSEFVGNVPILDCALAYGTFWPPLALQEGRRISTSSESVLRGDLVARSVSSDGFDKTLRLIILVLSTERKITT